MFMFSAGIKKPRQRRTPPPMCPAPRCSWPGSVGVECLQPPKWSKWTSPRMWTRRNRRLCCWCYRQDSHQCTQECDISDCFRSDWPLLDVLLILFCDNHATFQLLNVYQKRYLVFDFLWMCHYISILGKPRVINLCFPKVEFLIENKHGLR